MTAFAARRSTLDFALRVDEGVPALKQAPPQHVILGGEVIEFGVPEAERERQLVFQIPSLESMDELNVVRARVDISPQPVVQAPLSVPAPSGSARVVALPDGDPRGGALSQVIFRGLVIEGAPAEGLTLIGSNLSVQWKGSDPPVNASGGKELRILARLRASTGFGPPAAAAPAFRMPGNNGLYGDALGGARVTLTMTGERVDAVLSFVPPLEARAVELRVVQLPDASSLPHETEAVSFRADSLEATWVSGPRDLEISAHVPAMPAESPAPVASFGGAVSTERHSIDFSAAARSLLRTAYGAHADPTLALVMKAGSAGVLQVLEKAFEAEYRKLLVSAEGASIALRGGVETTKLNIAPGLRPARFTLTFDGRFGRSALVAAADSGRLDPNRPVVGYRVADTLAVARWVPLTVAEAARPLTRVSVEGRGSGDCELLVALHRGDVHRIGTRFGDPAAIAVPNESRPSWHRAPLGPVASAPPHPGGVWVVLQVSRGTFWWSATFSDTEGPPVCQRSPDAGATFDTQPGQPRTQVHQDWVEDSTQEPLPEPIACYWPDGALRSDIRVQDQLTQPAFRGVGIALLGERDLAAGAVTDPASPLDRVAALGETLELSFDCRRDVDFRILDAAMTYSPWLSRG